MRTNNSTALRFQAVVENIPANTAVTPDEALGIWKNFLFGMILSEENVVDTFAEIWPYMQRTCQREEESDSTRRNATTQGPTYYTPITGGPRRRMGLATIHGDTHFVTETENVCVIPPVGIKFRIGAIKKYL